MKLSIFAWLVLLSFSVLSFVAKADQAATLRKVRKHTMLKHSQFDLAEKTWKTVAIADLPGDSTAKDDKITSFPGQPNAPEFEQYSGYVAVNPERTKQLFYYFAESPTNASAKPLVLWLNGGAVSDDQYWIYSKIVAFAGPGCSSFGTGAMTELGPFRVHNDGQTLFPNDYSWNNVANVLFLESPAGVGFSITDSHVIGDNQTMVDAYTFILKWLDRFPVYRDRDFYITGESYAGHYVPQLAVTILENNKITNQSVINLKGIAIGNAYIDETTTSSGTFDYYWSHAMISDETYSGILQFCNFTKNTSTNHCDYFLSQAYNYETGDINTYDIIAPLCHNSSLKNGTVGSVHEFDPCTDGYVVSYLNNPAVQVAIHAVPTKWEACSLFDWTDMPLTVLPIIQSLIESGIRVWIYSGDMDVVIPVTSSRYAINLLKLPIKSAWRPWYTNKEVGGYVVEYDGLTFVTVRGAGHMVPSYQPERALTMISSFLQGTPLPPPPSSPANN
ncbi:hypothetical protein ACFE04_026836 [Oxalis oulophora]